MTTKTETTKRIDKKAEARRNKVISFRNGTLQAITINNPAMYQTELEKANSLLYREMERRKNGAK